MFYPCFSWSAIFFYVYTSTIAFAPLSSRGIKKAAAGENEAPDRADSPLCPQNQTLGATKASSSKKVMTGVCSPKSIYALASKV
jgi:long-subunit fatty acid transport protein